MQQKNPDLLLIGDSITYNWKAHGKTARRVFLDHRNYVNLGIGGDRVEHILWRIKNDEVDPGKPKLAIVLAGTNNIPRKVSTERIVAGMREVLRELCQRQPQMTILLIGVLPRGKSPDNPYWKQALAITAGYKDLADGKNTIFLDISPQLLGPNGAFKDGVICPDNIHLDQEGYFIWAEAMEPIISRFLGDQPVTRPTK